MAALYFGAGAGVRCVRSWRMVSEYANGQYGFVLSLMFIALATWHALIGRDADLVEGRRRFRLVLVISAALYTAGIVVSQWLLPGSAAAAPTSEKTTAPVAAIERIPRITRPPVPCEAGSLARQGPSVHGPRREL